MLRGINSIVLLLLSAIVSAPQSPVNIKAATSFFKTQLIKVMGYVINSPEKTKKTEPTEK